MNNDTIGTATVKITADIQELKTKVEEAKNVAKKLDGFKINVGEEFSGDWKQYQEYVRNTQAEFEKLAEDAQELNAQFTENASTVRESADANDTASESAETLGASFEQASEQIEEATEAVSQSSQSMLSSIRDAFSQAGQLADGFVTRFKEALTKKLTSDRGYLAIGAGIVAAIKKSISAAGELDEEFGGTLDRMNSAFEKVGGTIGRVFEPAIELVTPLVEGLANVLDVLTTPLKWIADGIRNVKDAVGEIFGSGGLVRITSQTSSLTAEEKAQQQALAELVLAQKEYEASLADTREEVGAIRNDIADLTYDYRQSLKRILVDHEGTVGRLTEQIKDANREYQRAIEERNASFAVSQAKEEKEHQDKVDELMTQIAFLQRYNNNYNKEKLVALKFALEKENYEYKKQSDAVKQELEAQNKAEKEKLDQRLAEYQKELDEETAFLRKHRETLNSVRDEILADEVEQLQRQYSKQLESYNKQITTASQKGKQAGEAYARAYSKAYDETLQMLKEKSGGKKDYGIGIDSQGNAFVGEVISASEMGRYLAGYAEGGYTGQGATNEVAGIVHKGEYVLPQEAVDQTTGTPKAMGNTYNINVSGVFATSAMERRKVAEDIKRALEQTNYARLGA